MKQIQLEKDTGEPLSVAYRCNREKKQVEFFEIQQPSLTPKLLFSLRQDPETAEFKREDHAPALPNLDADHLKQIYNELAEEIGLVEETFEESELSDEFYDKKPYDISKIRFEPKQFLLRNIMDMVKDQDLDLEPDFQRKLVWNYQRKARLIESVLLKIPLPMFYFSASSDGKYSVIDGLQRLSSIREYIENKFELRQLEYENDDFDKKKFEQLDNKWKRLIHNTQITVYIIDHETPIGLTYDLFRRLNTSGRPLNYQEIRNCMARPQLRNLLKQMVREGAPFRTVTGGSVRPARLEDQELGLRFLLFLDLYLEDSTLENFTDKMETALDLKNDELSKHKNLNSEAYENAFHRAMHNAYHLFQNQAFRKYTNDNLGKRRQPINKALFVAWSVLLSQLDAELVKQKPVGYLTEKLANRITNDQKLLSYLSYSTNSKANIQAIFRACEELLRTEGLLSTR